MKNHIAIPLLLLFVCVVFAIFQYGEPLKRIRLQKRKTANFVDEVELYSSLFSKGVTLQQPRSHGYPSFNIGSLDGTYLPFARIECGKEVLKPGQRIPNIVHYVWFGIFKINMIQYYAIRSAALIQKPRWVIFHMDTDEPVGPYWERLKAEIPCIKIVNLQPPTKVFDRIIQLVEHKSDVARINILLKYGGIYSDVNVVFVRPMDELMKHAAVLGKEEDKSYGNSFILSEKNSSFVQIWLESYINFDYRSWSDHSTAMPRKLHELFPELPLHVEQYSMMRPNYNEGPRWLSHNNWDLRYNYCVHLYVNEPGAKALLKPVLDFPESDLVTLDNTFGQLIRISLFGTPYFMVNEMDTQIMEAHSSIACGTEVSTFNNDVIPNILHYVWNGEKLLYHHYLAMRSTIQNTKPDAVYFHSLSGSDPFYRGYLLMLREITCLEIVDSTNLSILTRKSMSEPYLQKVLPGLHILYKHGGILMDFNTTLLKPVNEFMAKEFVIGRSTEQSFEYSIIMSKQYNEDVLQWMKHLQNVTNFQDFERSFHRVLKKRNEKVGMPENFILTPSQNWLQEENADIPTTYGISLRNSSWNSAKEEANEKYILTKNNFLGVFAKRILIENSR